MNELYFKTFENEFAREKLEEITLPHCFENLKAESRHYQVEGFKRFIYHFEKKNKPIDLLFQMATGSGKTHMMAGLMLYLFEKGYNKFIFFVNSKNILTKTRENFLNANSLKYLFKRDMEIKEVSNFDYVPEDKINVIFTTIQMLKGDLFTPKENSLCFEDLAKEKIVLLADEAHHLNAETKAKTKDEKEDSSSWEGAVKKILNSNKENILLQFTATIDMENKELLAKYKDKLIYKYDFLKFREDGFSKDVFTLQTSFDELLEEERLFKRTLVALVISEYRRFIASEVGINLKPVILIKLNHIKTTQGAMEYFLKRMEDLKEIDLIHKDFKDIALKAFSFFEGKNLVNLLKDSFNKETIHIATNNEKEDYILQTMETNKIRMVYDCERLNEGWDVLNLFDIVRLYETRSESKTIKEAQLIGRGARYFPISFEKDDNKYTRKFDSDLTNKLRVLEQMHYHCQKESKYINELKTALEKEGIQPKERKTIEMKVKDEFKKEEIYTKGRIYMNERKKKSLKEAITNYNLHEEIKVKTRNFEIKEHHILNKQEETNKPKENHLYSISLIEKNKLLFAMDDNKEFNDFFNFKNLRKRFDIKSRNDFLEKIYNTKVRCSKRAALKDLQVIKQILRQVKNRIEENYFEFEGEENFLISETIQNLFGESRTITINNGKELDVKNNKFMVQDIIKVTSEEESFINFINSNYEEIRKKVEYFYIIRNERKLKIFDKKGRATEPDFIIISKLNNNQAEELKLQIFIEPKGNQFKDREGGFQNSKEGWKQEFLESLNVITDNRTNVKGVFYNEDMEDEFKDKFDKIFNLS